MFLCSTAYTQYESVPLRLVTSEGAPFTGQSAQISFRRAPFGIDDDIDGLTVTEDPPGNYLISGFTTFEKAKYYFSGVEQTWWGGPNGLYVGDIVPWINSLLTTSLGNYILKVGSVTGISGNKTISSGDWLKLGGTETWYKPYIYSGSSWVSDYSAVSNNGLIFRDFADSIYGVKPYFISGLEIHLLSGRKLWGTSKSQPIQINTSHFTWSTSTGLNLYLPYQQDSLYFKKDTVISENSYTKSWSLNRNRWNQVSPWDLWMVYRNTLDASIDSSQVINEIVTIASSNTATNLDSADYSTIQTFNFPYPAYWDVHIYYEYEFEYITPIANCYDSIYASAWSSTEYTDPAFLITDACHKYAYIASTPTGQRGTGELNFQINITPGNIGDTYSFAGICSGIAHKSGGSAKSFIRKWKIITTKIR